MNSWAGCGRYEVISGITTWLWTKTIDTPLVSFYSTWSSSHRVHGNNHSNRTVYALEDVQHKQRCNQVKFSNRSASPSSTSSENPTATATTTTTADFCLRSEAVKGSIQFHPLALPLHPSPSRFACGYGARFLPEIKGVGWSVIANWPSTGLFKRCVVTIASASCK